MNDTHYHYKCEDHSILLRVLHRPVFMPVVRTLPRVVTPNQITVFGNVLVWATFALVLAARPAGPGVFIVLAATLALYVLADCVDGLFARHTQRASHLGELLDHGLDSLSLPLVTLAFTLAMNQPAWLVISGTAAVAFINFVTEMHGYRAGYVHLGSIGIIEGILGGAAACVIAAIIGVEPLARPLLGSVSAAGFLVIGLVGGSMISLIEMRRLAGRLSDFAPITLMFAVVIAWFAGGRLSAVTAALLLTMISVYQACAITRARLLRVPLVLWDGLLVALTIGAAGACVGCGLDEHTQTTAAGVVLAYAGARGSWMFLHAVRTLNTRHTA